MLRRNQVNYGSFSIQSLLGSLRSIAALVTLLAVGVYGAVHFDGVNPPAIADEIIKNSELLHLLGRGGRDVLIVFAAIFNFSTLRFLIPPLIVIVFVFIAGAFYLMDVYKLEHFRDALNYILASMFAYGYPSLEIDEGIKQVNAKEVNLIERVGGPGFVHVEPGNAAMFRDLRHFTAEQSNTTYFLSPFETVAQTITLDDQQIIKDDIPAMTRDGIKVLVQGINIRYRIKTREREGIPIRRSINEPYPVDNTAMQRMAANTSVTAKGPESWDVTISRIVVGAITDFVSAHTIDALTTPNCDPANPRLELRNELMYRSIKRALDTNGAELIMVGAGHLHIVDERVDTERANAWAVPWMGESRASRELAKAKQEAYQTLGRAEAHAETVLSMMDALRDVSFTATTPLDVRRLLLMRTGQLLESYLPPADGKDQPDDAGQEG